MKNVLRLRQHRDTRKIELVETNNIAVSILRIRHAPGYDSSRWKRALYHAMLMSYAGTSLEQELVRKALGLP